MRPESFKLVKPCAETPGGDLRILKSNARPKAHRPRQRDRRNHLGALISAEPSESKNGSRSVAAARRKRKLYPLKRQKPPFLAPGVVGQSTQRRLAPRQVVHARVGGSGSHGAKAKRAE